MNKKLVALGAVALAIGLAGCAKKDDMKVVECAFPDAPDTSAPLWVCDAPVEGVAVSAVGSHPKSGAGVDFMKQQAAASARVALAQQMKVHVTNMIKQYVETTGAADSETVDKVNTSVSKLITAETIEGSKIFRTITSPAGAIYVLVGMDPNLTARKTQDAIRTSMNNERALWQQFKAQKGQDELAADIAKMQGK